MIRLGDPRVVWDARAQLGEGTCWSAREQALYWVDIYGMSLHRVSPDGRDRRTWMFDEPISAVAECIEARRLAVTLRRGLALFDPVSGRLERGIEPELERTGNRFNDGKCDAQGRFWAGTMDYDCAAPTGALYRYEADGRVTRALEAGYPVTNGPTWSRDGRTLYFNDTARRRVNAFDFDPASGELARPRCWTSFGEHDGYPDGMTTDAAGRIWIAHWGGACITAHDPDSAEELARVRLPASQITNIAFGGPALQTLFVTSARRGAEGEARAGAVFAIESDVTGVPAHLYGR